jgi:hypothetical protein
MKRIKLNQVKSPDKSSIYTNAQRHTLCLGNDVKLSFTNKRAFNSAVFHINEDLTGILYQINDAYVLCFTEYRRLWFYLENQHSRTLHKSDEYQMELTRLFNLLSDRNGWANGNYFAFKYFYMIIDSLVGWLDNLVELRHKKKQYVEMRLLQQKQKEIAAIRLTLDNVGKKDPE